MNLKVASYNISCKVLSEQLLSWADKENIDILLLQEIEEEDTSAAIAVAEVQQFHYAYAVAREVVAGRTHGLAVLSKYPILNGEAFELPRFDLKINSRRRIAQLVEVAVQGVTVQLANVHLDSRLNIDQRILQLQPALQKLNESPQSKQILAGDFNTVPFQFWQNLIPIYFKNQYKILNEYIATQQFTTLPSLPYTFRPNSLRWLLDAIYIKGANLNSIQTAPIDFSDHTPVIAEILL